MWHVSRLFGSLRTATGARAPRRTTRNPLGLERLEQRLALTIALDIFDNTGLGTAGDVYVTGHGIPGAPGAPKDDLRVLDAGGSFTQGAVKVANASWDSGTARITTPVPHYVQPHQKVFVSGVSAAGYNGIFTVTAIEPGGNPTWFEYQLTDSPGAGADGAAYL